MSEQVYSIENSIDIEAVKQVIEVAISTAVTQPQTVMQISSNFAYCEFIWCNNREYLILLHKTENSTEKHDSYLLEILDVVGRTQLNSRDTEYCELFGTAILNSNLIDKLYKVTALGEDTIE